MGPQPTQRCASYHLQVTRVLFTIGDALLDTDGTNAGPDRASA